MTPLDTWLYFLRYAENLDPEALPEHMNTAEIRQAMEALEVISHVDLRKEMYEDRIKAVMDERSRLADSHSSGISIGREEGISIGREEGISIGRNIGREEGVSIGREEGEKEGERKGSLNAVPILLELGASVERIAEALNLDVDEVRQVAASS